MNPWVPARKQFITHKKLVNPLCPQNGHSDTKGYFSSQ